MGRGVQFPYNLKITGFYTANSQMTIEYRIAFMGVVECFHNRLIGEMIKGYRQITQMVPVKSGIISGVSFQEEGFSCYDQVRSIARYFSRERERKRGGIHPLMGKNMGRILRFKGKGEEMIRSRSTQCIGRVVTKRERKCPWSEGKNTDNNRVMEFLGKAFLDYGGYCVIPFLGKEETIKTQNYQK